jgi:hypothetical protein
MAMAQFKRDIQEVSVRNYIENRKNTQERDVRMSFCMTQIAQDIIDDSQNFIIEASKKGRFGCSIYECSSSTKFNDEFRCVYLLRGPYHCDSNVEFFESKGMTSVLSMVRDALDPIDVYLKYDVSSSTHKIVAVWKTT